MPPTAATTSLPMNPPFHSAAPGAASPKNTSTSAANSTPASRRSSLTPVIPQSTPYRTVTTATFKLGYREPLIRRDGSAIAEEEESMHPSQDALSSTTTKKRPAARMSGALAAYDTIRDFIPDNDVRSSSTPSAGTGDSKSPTAGADASSARAQTPRKLRINRNDLRPPSPSKSADDADAPANQQGDGQISPDRISSSNNTSPKLRPLSPLHDRVTLDSILMSNFNLSSDQQAVAIAWMLEEVGALACLPDITSEDLIHFVRTVQLNYNTPPFHNFAHAFCVTQVAFVVLKETGLIDELSEAVSTMLLIAALCHDVDHEGLTNAYHIATESSLAQWYNDTCPMENHHAALTKELLKSPHSILRNLDAHEAKHFRQVITQLILATDMGRHDQVLSQGLKLVGTRLSVADPAHLTVLLQTILKASDLSNELRPANVADAWSAALYEELNLEMAKLGRSAIPTDVGTVSKGQVDFLTTKVLPIWSCLSDLIAPAGRTAKTLVQRVKDAIHRHEVRVIASAAERKVTKSPTMLSNPMIKKNIPTTFNPAPPSVPFRTAPPVKVVVRDGQGNQVTSSSAAADGITSISRRRHGADDDISAQQMGAAFAAAIVEDVKEDEARSSAVLSHQQVPTDQGIKVSRPRTTSSSSPSERMGSL
ncbi:hypothetical protein BCR44DRAFT_74591 [Catenaria anguillulae PL171]|uniref:Phosphodiesterase n=1 Tax=Catenaria anguillulae PL171 TaxID=765915 RepID=A0A1Y2I2H9_9FUNG|nr:hypothetical protein BCR44DRAFT_74591 [Catenaria anguillulae PL171]